MTIAQAIVELEEMVRKYGNVEIFFDCPKCKISFTPDVVAATAIHLSSKDKK